MFSVVTRRIRPPSESSETLDGPGFWLALATLTRSQARSTSN